MDRTPFDDLQNANIGIDRPGSVVIHPDARIEEGAELSPGVVIGAYSIIGRRVKLGPGTRVGSHVIISGRTDIGKENRIFPFSVIGSAPQDLKHDGATTALRIGSGNTIREYVNISTGTRKGGGETVIGENNMIMAYSHIAHDCRIGDHCLLANAVQLAGHVQVESSAVLSAGVVVHQFSRIGCHSFVVAQSAVLQDIPPYAWVLGSPVRFRMANSSGLRDRGWSESEINQIKEAFRILYDRNKRLQERLNLLSQIQSEKIQHLVQFVQDSEKGFCPIDED